MARCEKRQPRACLRSKPRQIGGRAMSRSQLVATLKKFDAEDRAVSYLAKLPKAVGKMMAVKTALALNYAWEVEEQRMIQRNNPRKVYRSSNDERCWLNRISAK